MKSSNRYYNSIEIEDEDPYPNLQSVRKQTNSGFDHDLNKKLSEQLIGGLVQEINKNLIDSNFQTYFKIKF